jgi:hypothetical protein
MIVLRGGGLPPEGYIRGRQRCPDEQQGCLCVYAEEELLEMIISSLQLERLIGVFAFRAAHTGELLRAPRANLKDSARPAVLGRPLVRACAGPSVVVLGETLLWPLGRGMCDRVVLGLAMGAVRPESEMGFWGITTSGWPLLPGPQVSPKLLHKIPSPRRRQELPTRCQQAARPRSAPR